MSETNKNNTTQSNDLAQASANQLLNSVLNSQQSTASNSLVPNLNTINTSSPQAKRKRTDPIYKKENMPAASQDSPLQKTIGSQPSLIKSSQQSPPTNPSAIQLNTKFNGVKYKSDKYTDIPILHPTKVTSTADIVLKVIEEEETIAIIPLNKQLLVDNIPYFSTRLNETWSSENQSEVNELSLDTSVASKEIILQYFKMIYKSEALPNKENAGGLYRLSMYLQDMDMAQVFKNFIQQNINDSVFFVAWMMDDKLIQEECLNYLKKNGLQNLLENFKDAGMNLLEDSVCKFIDEAVDKIKAEEQGHLLDLLKIWLINHEVKTVEVYYRIFKKIPFDKFMTHFRQVFKSHLLEMLDEKLTLEAIKPIMNRVLDKSTIGVSRNIGSSNTISCKEVRKRIFPYETLDDEHMIPMKKISDEKAEYRGGVKNNKPNGKGSKKWDNGTIHYGEWKNGVPNGAGVRTWPKDGVFSGLWVDGEWKQGAYIWPTGGKYS